MTVKYTSWRLLPGGSKNVDEMAQKFRLPEQICAILLQRNLEDEEDLHHFLYPKLERLPLPSLMKGLNESVRLILDAKQNNQEVIVYGDYDVDGVTSTALLYGFLEKIDIRVTFYHPNRIDEGYGLSLSSVDAIVARHPHCLIVTVDCGISDSEPVEYARKKGLSVIITDHHLPPDKLPEANAIINPLQKGCDFPFKYLAGVGIAFYLIIGIRGKLRDEGYWSSETQPNLKELLDLVAIGSVADMVPLVGVNRILVKAGLDSINSKVNLRKGLAGLFRICNIVDKNITVEDIGYQLGPRINAAGRLGRADVATRLLTCNDPDIAYELAEQLNQVNEERKKMAEVQTEQAMQMVQGQLGQDRKIVILHRADWHHGLIGIIASRICEATNKPTVILAGEPVAKGSARTTPTCNIYDLLNYCGDCLEQFGGHKMAAGLTVNVLKIQDFINAAEKYAAVEKIEKQVNELIVDAILPTDGQADEFYKKYKMLGPFGTDNPEPKFMLEEPRHLRNVQVIGKNRDHLRFSVEILGRSLAGIGFGFGHVADLLGNNKTNIVFSISENWFKGRKSWQAVLHDVDVQVEPDVNSV